MSGKRRFKNVEADHFVLQIPQGANQGLAQMPGASRNQYLHVVPFRVLDWNQVGTMPLRS
jgi:hypothetical protein